MKEDSIEDVKKKLDVERATLANVAKGLKRELRVIDVLIAAGVLHQDAVDKARELVDSFT